MRCMQDRRCLLDDPLRLRRTLLKEIIMNRCFDCKFFIQHSFTEYSFAEHNFPNMGYCRKKPPFVEPNLLETRFPETPENGFCGDFEHAGPIDTACTNCNLLFRTKDALVAGDRMLFCPKCESKARRLEPPYAIEVLCDDCCETSSVVSGPDYLEKESWCPTCHSTSQQTIITPCSEEK